MPTKNLGNVRALIVSSTPPTNTDLLWRDTSVSPNKTKEYDTLALQWVDLRALPGATDLSVGIITGTTLDIDSSSGTNATIPAANATEAGVMAAAQYLQANAIPTGGTSGQALVKSSISDYDTEWANVGGSGTDPFAVHVNVADEISGITEKVTPVVADLLIIEDSADSNNKKRVTIDNLVANAGYVTRYTISPVVSASTLDIDFNGLNELYGTTSVTINENITVNAINYTNAHAGSLVLNVTSATRELAMSLVPVAWHVEQNETRYDFGTNTYTLPVGVYIMTFSRLGNIFRVVISDIFE